MFEIVLGQVSECSQNSGCVTRTQKNPRRKIAHSKDEKVELKSQSAMEYLMTYGWAILIIAIVLVAFFSLNLFNPYTFSPKASPGSCQILRPNGPGSNLFVSAVGPTCTTNEIPQYVASFSNNTESYVLINPAQILNIVGNVTVIAWIKPYLNKGQWYGIVSQRWPEYNAGQDYGISYYQCTSIIKCIYESYNNGVSWITQIGVSQPLNINEWVMVVSTRNMSSGEFKIYQNGAYVTTTPTNGLAGGFDNPVAIGADPEYGTPPTTYGIYFNGSIANVQIYNTSLSPSAVNTLYAEGIGGTPVDIQNLVGWWPLNGNSNDYSGNGNNGVPTNVVFTSNWESGYSAP